MIESNSHRKDFLEKVISIVTQDRNISYGTPEQSFKMIADLWNVLFSKKLAFEDGEGSLFQPSDVAKALICLKLARLVESPNKEDNWLDIAGYAACGWEAYLQADQKEF